VGDPGLSGQQIAALSIVGLLLVALVVARFRV
jgi:hypothetical protein